jgi:asparagine synthase (glutamine-hydrolysing)
VEHHGEPFGDASALPSFYLSELTSKYVTVALNGDGGDESFAGYSHYAANLLLAKLAAMPRPLQAAARHAVAHMPASGRIDSPLSRAKRLMQALPLPADARFRAYRTYLDGLDRQRLYMPEYREFLGRSRVDDVIATPWRESLSSDALDRMLDVDIATYLSGQLLTKIDIASMAYSLEARSPLLDHELMAFAASLPAELKLSGGQRKVAFRRALRGWVPDQILDARKQGFVLPICEWLRGELRDYARETLLDRAAVARGYFRRERLAALLEQHERGVRDNSRGIWNLLVFELWHQRFVDPPAEQHLPATGALDAARKNRLAQTVI